MTLILFWIEYIMGIVCDRKPEQVSQGQDEGVYNWCICSLGEHERMEGEWQAYVQKGRAQEILISSIRMFINTQEWLDFSLEIMNMIDAVLVKGDVLNYTYNVKTVSGMGRGISIHSVVTCEVQLAGTWMKKKKVL